MDVCISRLDWYPQVHSWNLCPFPGWRPIWMACKSGGYSRVWGVWQPCWSTSYRSSEVQLSLHVRHSLQWPPCSSQWWLLEVHASTWSRYFTLFSRQFMFFPLIGPPFNSTRILISKNAKDCGSIKWTHWQRQWTALINASDSADDFSVKLSLFMCSHSITACSGSPPQCSTFSSLKPLAVTHSPQANSLWLLKRWKESKFGVRSF